MNSVQLTLIVVELEPKDQGEGQSLRPPHSDIGKESERQVNNTFVQPLAARAHQLGHRECDASTFFAPDAKPSFFPTPLVSSHLSKVSLCYPSSRCGGDDERLPPRFRPVTPRGSLHSMPRSFFAGQREGLEEKGRHASQSPRACDKTRELRSPPISRGLGGGLLCHPSGPSTSSSQ